MLDILSYFSSIEFYYFALILIIIGAITQSAIGIGFGIPACFLVLFEPNMVPGCIVLMGTFLAFSNAFLSYRGYIKKRFNLFFLWKGSWNFNISSFNFINNRNKKFFNNFWCTTFNYSFLSAKKWNLKATIKNITIAGMCSGFMGTLTGVGGPPMAIVYQNSSARNAVATLNMFFGIGALFSVFVLAYIDLITIREVMRCLLLAPGVVAGLILGRQTIVKNYVNINLKKLILIVCFVSAVLVLGQAFIEF